MKCHISQLSSLGLQTYLSEFLLKELHLEVEVFLHPGQLVLQVGDLQLLLVQLSLLIGETVTESLDFRQCFLRLREKGTE